VEHTAHMVRFCSVSRELHISRTRMFGVSLLAPVTSFARRAVEAKVRIAAREQLVERATAPNGRATASRIAIV
jgi:hypothetical protein